MIRQWIAARFEGRRTRALIKLAVGTLLALAAWSGLVLVGTLQGWGRQPLVGKDPGAFNQAVVNQMLAGHQGNVAFVLMENGRVFDQHFASKDKPVGPDTQFQVASLSKWITAWGVMTLVEAGRLDLDAPVNTYLTRWKLPPGQFDNRKVTSVGF